MNTLTQEEIKQLQDKVNKLIKDQANKMDLQLIESVEDENMDVHVLYKRNSDGTYIVWTASHTGDTRTTYDGFHNGSYDMDIFQAVKEFGRRLGQ